MTIIKPNKNQIGFGYFIAFVLVMIFISGVFYISAYTSFADAKHGVYALQREISNLERENADLKNELYGIIDPGELEAIAMEMGLSLDRRPKYLRNGE